MANKENKDMVELGSKARAGRLLSNYLRAIADERTEIEDIATSPDTVEHKIISKAEAIARDMFRIAMGKGWVDSATNTLFAPDAKLVLEYRKLILERIEGKPGSGEEVENPKDGIPDRISEINKRRANTIAQEVMGARESSM